MKTPARPIQLARKTLICSLVTATLLTAGCSTGGDKRDDPLSNYSNAYAAGDYQAAIAAMPLPTAEEAEGKSSERDVLKLLHVAEAKRLSGDYQGAIDAYDLAESGLKDLDKEGKLEKGLEGAGSLAGLHADYTPYKAESILINTYKALAYLSLGDMESARVEFTRVDERTRRSVEHFENEIAAAASKKLEIAGRDIPLPGNLLNSDPELAAANPETDEPETDDVGFKGYNGFLVPAASYLTGIYDLASDEKDLGNAAFSLRQVVDTHKDVKYFNTELNEAESGRKLPGQLVWVVYENGQTSTLQELRIDRDVTFDSDAKEFHYHDENSSDSSQWKNAVQERGLNPYVLSVAIPKSVPGVEASAMKVNLAGGESVPMHRFSEMHDVSSVELSKREPAMKRMALISGLAKVAAQALAAKKAEEKSAGLGGFAARAMGAASSKTTSADIRSWRALPSHWEVTRFERPDDGQVELSAGSTAGSVELPKWSRTLIYVKRPTDNSPLRVSMIDLNGKNKAIEYQL